MIFQWIRDRRRRKLLESQWPGHWEPILRRNVSQFRYLNDSEQEKLRRCVRVFVDDKFWEGCSGLGMTDEIRVTIAGQACLLLLGLEADYYDNPQTILVYPDQYVVKEKAYRSDGVVSESLGIRLGEAHYRGPVILSWADVRRENHTPSEGRNTVLHEFAHVLDMLNDQIDGTPPLHHSNQYVTWRKVMTDEFRQLVRAVEEGRPTLIDPYGATDEAEFFAVATECFFEQPAGLCEQHQRLYGSLRDFYRQDPAGWEM